MMVEDYLIIIRTKKILIEINSLKFQRFWLVGILDIFAVESPASIKKNFTYKM